MPARPAAPAVGGEQMTVQAARTLAGCRSVLVGVGEPVRAAMLAQALYAPEITLCYESGIIGSRATELPLSIGDARLVDDAGALTSMFEMFALYLAAGRIEAGFVGCAQIDRAGNVNSTVIGPYDAPAARLPGSGGANDIVLAVSKQIVLTRHEPRRFPERVDFVTSTGPAESGCELIVVTDRAVLGFHGGELVVDLLMPGVERGDVEAATGWPVRFSPDLDRVPPATTTELEALTALRADGGTAQR